MLLTCWTGFYFRGILLERTGRRSSLYLWNVVLPRFHPSPNLALNFSDRLNSGFTLDGSEQEITDQAVAGILDPPGLRQRLETPLTPSEFLDGQTVALAHPHHKPLTTVFDLAASAALARQDELAMQLFNVIERRTSDEPTDQVRLFAGAVRDALRSGASVEQILERISQENTKI